MVYAQASVRPLLLYVLSIFNYWLTYIGISMEK